MTLIRRARPGDETEIVAMIRELAEFERAAEECTVTESQISTALFGDDPVGFCHLAEVDGQAAAIALWFRNFSTWDGVAGRLPRRPVRASGVSPPRAGPVRCWRHWPVNASTTATAG